MFLKLTTVPDKLLRQPSKAITSLDDKTAKLITDMVDTLIHKEDPPGIGLSAIQVGQPKQLFVTYLPPIHNLKTMDNHQPPQEIKVFINPKIIDKSEKMTLGPDKKHPALEGCLSIPNLYGPIYRHQTIKLTYQTVQLDPTKDLFLQLKPDKLIQKTEDFSHFYARVIQHEYDHLEGVLFTDYTKQDNLPLYFDQGKQLLEIEDPSALINW